MTLNCSTALPAHYVDQLESMTLIEIAREAARFRSDGRRPGTASHLIICWVRAVRPASFNRFQALYRKAWTFEKQVRANLRPRPSLRPVVGSRQRTERVRHGFAHQPALV